MPLIHGERENDVKNRIIALMEKKFSYPFSKLISGVNQLEYLENLMNNSKTFAEYFLILGRENLDIKNLIFVYMQFFKPFSFYIFDASEIASLNHLLISEKKLSLHSKDSRELLKCIVYDDRFSILKVLGFIIDSQDEIEFINYRSEKDISHLFNFGKRLALIIYEIEIFIYQTVQNIENLKKLKLRIIIFVLTLTVLINFYVMMKLKKRVANKKIEKLLNKEKLL